jgi:hypothetical protein
MMTGDTPDGIATPTLEGLGVGWTLREVQQRSAAVRFPVPVAGLLVADTLLLCSKRFER